MSPDSKTLEIISWASKIDEKYRRALEKDKKYKEIFYRDFQVELRYKSEMFPATPSRDLPGCSEKPWLDNMKLSSGNFKNLYRELAKKTHPDMNIDSESAEDMEIEFREISEAYNSGDAVSLVKSAAKHGIDFDMDDVDCEKIKKSADEQLKYLLSMKQSTEWAWCASDRNINDRKNMWTHIGLDKKKFKFWMSENPHEQAIYNRIVSSNKS